MDFIVGYKELKKLSILVDDFKDADAIQKAPILILELNKYSKLAGAAVLLRQEIIIKLMQKQISALTKRVLALSK